MVFVTEKRLPHYSLDSIKAAFASTASLNRTFSAVAGAEDLRLDDAAVVAVVQALTSKDFDKSMTSHADKKIWQDVYRPSKNGMPIYVKFTLNSQQQFILISFKEA